MYSRHQLDVFQITAFAGFILQLSKNSLDQWTGKGNEPAAWMKGLDNIEQTPECRMKSRYTWMTAIVAARTTINGELFTTTAP